MPILYSFTRTNDTMVVGAPHDDSNAAGINGDHSEIAGVGVAPGVPSQDVFSGGHAFLLVPVGAK